MMTQALPARFAILSDAIYCQLCSTILSVWLAILRAGAAANGSIPGTIWCLLRLAAKGVLYPPTQLLLGVHHVTIGKLRARHMKMMMFVFLMSCAAFEVWRLPWRHYVSRLLDRTSLRYPLSASTVRSLFNRTPNAGIFTPSNHPHPFAAATRTAAVNTIQGFIRAMGKRPYSEQTSSRDDRDEIDGSRTYYWGKDLHIKARLDSLTPDHVPYLIDVDYYVDMNYFLALAKRPVLLYTLQPSSAGRVTDKDYSYCWTDDNQVEYKVAGSQYKHEVWNYQFDSIGAANFGSIYPWRWTVTNYAIEKRNIDQDHEIVLLMPTGTWNGFYALIAHFLVVFRYMARFKPVLGDMVCIESRTTARHTVSLGAPGFYSATDLPVTIVDTARTQHRVNKVGMGIAAAKSLITTYADANEFDKQQLDQAAAMLTNYVTRGDTTRKMTVFPREFAVRRYQFGDQDPDAKPSMEAFMTPLVHEGFAPDVTVGNEVKAIYGRLERFQTREQKPMPKFVGDCVRSFVEGLIDQPRCLHPVDKDEVWERQHRPSQRQILRRADLGNSHDRNAVLESFNKREAYQAPSDPRIITQANAALKAEYSQYIYALSDTMHDVPWYAFGHTPLEVSYRVSRICQDSLSAGVSDFSRFDGHVDQVARILEYELLIRAFHPMYHEDLIELHGCTYQRKAVGRLGTMYNTGYSRCSGMPDTSLGNTILNAFVTYLSIRMDHDEDGKYKSHQTAWDFLCTKCLFGGDDGLVGDPSNKWPAAAKLVNQDLDLQIIERESLGVTFLSRYYDVDVWHGSCLSCCDIPRQLRKLHLTPQLAAGVTPMMKLAEKMRSFLLSDELTPVIGKMARTFHEVVDVDNLLKDRALDLLPIRRWDSQYCKEDQYPNAHAPWMFRIIENELGDFDFLAFGRWLDQCKEDPALFLTPPLFVEPRPPKVKDTVTVDDDVHVVPGSNPKQRAKVERRPPIHKPQGDAPPLVPLPAPVPSNSTKKKDNRAKQKVDKKVEKKSQEQQRPKVELVRKASPKPDVASQKPVPPPKAKGGSVSTKAPKLGGKRGAHAGGKNAA